MKTYLILPSERNLSSSRETKENTPFSLDSLGKCFEIEYYHFPMEHLSVTPISNEKELIFNSIRNLIDQYKFIDIYLYYTREISDI